LLRRKQIPIVEGNPKENTMTGVPDISPADTWAALEKDPNAVLVDVRWASRWC